MYTLKQIREHMVEFSLSESEKEWFQVSGADLQEALHFGAEKLNVSPELLEYEIVQKGDKGLGGLGKKLWIIRVTQMPVIEEEQILAEEVASQRFSLHLRNSRVFLKVVKQKHEPFPHANEILTELRKRLSRGISETHMIERVIKKASGKFEPIAEFTNNPRNNASIECSISDDELSAFIVLFPPEVDGFDITAQDVTSSLRVAGITYGIDTEAITHLVEYPHYKVPLQIAKGTSAENEEDATIDYTAPIFSEGFTRSLEDISKFREVNNLPNTHQGDVIARKISVSRGKEGVSVTGKIIFPQKGKDVEFHVGANVEISSDGASAIALRDGMVRLKNGMLSVEPIYCINGDVNMKVGNIYFVGAVVIKGDVLDGFVVESEGDLQVFGSVGKATLISKGNIYLQRGMAGGGEGKIIAKGNVWARFLENCNVKVDEYLLVSDGIVNSFVEVTKGLVCRGKRASLVGGTIYAGEFVDVKGIGALSGVKTSVGVGIPPALRVRELEIRKTETRLQSEQQSLEQKISIREHKIRIEKMGKENEGEEPQQELIEFREQRAANHLQLEELWVDMEEIQREMEEYSSKGMVSVLRRIFPGVTITVGNAQLPIQQEYFGVSFVQGEGMVKIQKYTETKISIPRPV